LARKLAIVILEGLMSGIADSILMRKGLDDGGDDYDAYRKSLGRKIYSQQVMIIL